MNANELADWLDNIADSKDWGELKKYYKKRLKNAATMLLQQQVEFEALKNQLWDLKSEPWGFDRYEKVQNK